MKLEELIPYTPNKVAHNFKDLTGTETEAYKIICRVAPPEGKANAVYWGCQCKICGDYCIKIGTNLKRDKSCGCARKKNISNARRNDLTGQKFGMLTVIEYTGRNNASRNAIWRCKCDCGNECEVDSNNLTSLHTVSCGCIKREKSVGAHNIEQILKEHNIAFSTEIGFNDLYDKDANHLLRYDFGIYEADKLLRLIEFDGIQHFCETWGKWNSNDTLKDRQMRDELKNQYALSHNIPLVRIPYWERDNITLDMLLGDKYLVTAATGPAGSSDP